MTTSRHSSRSPIVEAIVAFQAELPESVQVTDLEGCQDPAYPDKKTLDYPADSDELGNASSMAAGARSRGFLFSSADGHQLFQARSDGFTMRRLVVDPENWTAE